MHVRLTTIVKASGSGLTIGCELHPLSPDNPPLLPAFLASSGRLLNERFSGFTAVPPLRAISRYKFDVAALVRAVKDVRVSASIASTNGNQGKDLAVIRLGTDWAPLDLLIAAGIAIKSYQNTIH